MYLNVLIADDCEDDALLIVRELRKSGYEPQFERVETVQAWSRRLSSAIGN
jgi:hypothetical protein